ELELLAGGDVGDAAPAAVGDRGDRPELRGVRDAVWDADPHHELARRVAPGEDAPPFEPVEVGFLDCFPPERGVARDLGADVQAVLLGLELLDLVHAIPPPASRSKRAPPPALRGRHPCLTRARRRAHGSWGSSEGHAKGWMAAGRAKYSKGL